MPDSAPPSAPRPCAALPDVNGTLVDSNDHRARARIDAFGEFGHAVPSARVRPLIGRGGDKVIPALTGVDPTGEEGEQISARPSAITEERYLPRVCALPPARALLERMRREGLTPVIAASAEADEDERRVRIAGVEGVVGDQTTAADARRSEPDPDVIVAALREPEVEPAAAIMLGDTPYDVEAAAGAGGVAFRSGGWTDADWRGALAVDDGRAALLARVDASPFAQPALAGPAGPAAV